MMGVNPLLDALLLQTIKSNSATPAERGFSVHPVPTTKPIRETNVETKLADQAPPRPHSHAASQAYRSVQHGASTVITLNGAAQLIADVMAKYPRESFYPVLRLLPLPAANITHSGVISSFIREAIEHSGLFYESHLARWFRGEYPESQLRKEPQFHRFAHSEEASKFVALSDNSLKGSEDRMHLMVRHQLELMANPFLRLEGQLLNGIPFSFLLQHGLPVPEGGEESPAKEQKPVWNVLIRLEHVTFEYVDFFLTLEGTALDIKISGNSFLLQEYFRRDYPDFRKRFTALGITEIEFSRKLFTRFSEMPATRLPTLLPQYHDKVESNFDNEYGDEAYRVFEQAVRNRLTAHDSSQMVGLLMNLEMDKHVPPALYLIVEILVAWVLEQIEHLSAR